MITGRGNHYFSEETHQSQIDYNANEPTRVVSSQGVTAWAMAHPWGVKLLSWSRFPCLKKPKDSALSQHRTAPLDSSWVSLIKFTSSGHICQLTVCHSVGLCWLFCVFSLHLVHRSCGSDCQRGGWGRSSSRHSARCHSSSWRHLRFAATNRCLHFATCWAPTFLWAWAAEWTTQLQRVPTLDIWVTETVKHDH